MKINITLSNLSPLEHEEIYQCFYDVHTISVHTQAIKLDQNHLSCPTPTIQLANNPIGNDNYCSFRIKCLYTNIYSMDRSEFQIRFYHDKFKF